jgi:hypothetical protein
VQLPPKSEAEGDDIMTEYRMPVYFGNYTFTESSTRFTYVMGTTDDNEDEIPF